MKRLFLFIAFILPVFVFAQDQLVFEENFKISKKIDIDNINQMVADFMNKENTEITSENNYNGKTKLYYLVQGTAKYKYFYNYLFAYKVEDNRFVASYDIISIDGEKILCDQSQATKEFDLSYGNSLSMARNYCARQLDRLEEYIKSNGQKYIKDINSEPSSFGLSYIISSSSITYFKVIQSENNLNKQDLYRIVDNYFAYAYRDGKSVIQNRDPEACSIVGKGYYLKTHIYNNGFLGFQEIYDIPHIVRIDCRDGRIRVSITISDYEITKNSHSKYVKNDNYTRNLLHYKPFGGIDDEEMEECLEKLVKKISSQFNEIKKSIDKGLTPVDNLDDW